MKILLSAFAFTPLFGSECGVGWHWAVAMARSRSAMSCFDSVVIVIGASP